jgi:O-antigen ligase
LRFLLTDLHARSIAGLGIVLLVLGVTANGQEHAVGRLALDSVIVMVPIAILMLLPYVRRKGIAGLPAYLLGPAALLFLACGLISVTVNGGQFASLLTVARYASYFILTMEIAVVTQDAAVRRLLLWTIGATGGVSALLALAQYADPQLTPGMHGIGPEITTRVVATFYNSNFYAEYLILVAGVLIALAFTEGRFGRLTAIVIGVVVGIALLLTYTRGSWIGLAVGLAVVALVLDWRYLAGIIVLALAGVFLVPGVTTRLAASADNGGSASFRLGLWQVAGEAMRRHPFFGYGAGDFLGAYRDVVTTRSDLYAGYLGFGAHNSYFELGAEIGVLGAIAFAVVTITYATRGLYVATREGVSPYTKYVALGLSVGLIGFIVNTFTSNTFQHPQSGLFFWILCGVVAGLGTGLWQEQPRDLPSRTPAETGLIGGSASLGWVSRTRRWIASAWRSSLTFAETAEPRSPRAAWFSSSLVMRAVFGSGPESPEGS